jgi:uncharacterized membrane protein YuzA (DUF378 family)
MRPFHITCLVLTIIGALNWGPWGLFQFDLVAAIFDGQEGSISRVIYSIVGIAGLCLIYTSAVIHGGLMTYGEPSTTHREPTTTHAGGRRQSSHGALSPAQPMALRQWGSVRRHLEAIAAPGASRPPPMGDQHESRQVPERLRPSLSARALTCPSLDNAMA